MNKPTTFMQFPCLFPLKIIGNKHPLFVTEMVTLIREHFPNTQEDAIRHNASKSDKYLSLTVSLYVEDQPSLDALYRELTKHPDIKMVL